MTETPYPSLFAPTRLAGKELRNRVVHASMATSLAQHQQVTDALVQYHANRARGGAAMIVTEPLACAPHQQQALRVRVWDQSQLGGLARWADAVESAGCRLLAQIQDPGRARHVPGRNWNAIGASPRPDGISWTIPRALTTDEVRRLIDSFANSAGVLQRCGFSGVELSAGHGHLFHQFMLATNNVRTDAYGGSFENRLRESASRHNGAD
jgi:dimethylglycine catabolism A